MVIYPYVIIALITAVKAIFSAAENAFSKIDELIIECKKLDRNTLILCALGPTATVLCSKISKYGYQAIDIGHIDIEYELFLMGATDVVAVKDKYVNEANSSGNNLNFKNEKYENEIIARVNKIKE